MVMNRTYDQKDITSGSATTIQNPREKQVGGEHYKNWKIQPIEFAMVNGLDLCQANVVKYVCRFRDKGGREDLEKARHYIDLLIEYEYGSE